jgi:hypothetical protein
MRKILQWLFGASTPEIRASLSPLKSHKRAGVVGEMSQRLWSDRFPPAIP